uniref:macro domain-containing protein n=1 Tax=Thaumasiovibrio occultus TaxID=1891184 RepID=UPI000B35D897|nr:macro domain-containing protein [Thaumasiovibrio occultus]
MDIELVKGDLLEQEVEVIVNAWNRNIIPWWLLLPQGVSGAIKKHAGYAPFKEIGRMGAIPLGQARETSAGKLAYQSIIHVAGINMFWCATHYSVTQSVVNAMNIVNQKGYQSVAFPLIGAGSGNRSEAWSLNLMQQTFANIESNARVVLVQYQKR